MSYPNNQNFNLRLSLDSQKEICCMKILLIEDEKALAISVQSFLKGEGFVCELADNFSTGIEKASIYEYDCILVDIGLPDGNGLDIVREIKKNNLRSGIIIISAKDALDDKITGLDLGADDYLPKPFHLAELNARIRSLLRRRQFDAKNEIVFNEIRILPDQGLVFIRQNQLSLTKKEYEMLLFFVVNRKRILKKEIIAEHLWGDHMDVADNYDFIYTHMSNLRKKMLDAGCNDYITTVYGMGYKFTDETNHASL